MNDRSVRLLAEVGAEPADPLAPHDVVAVDQLGDALDGRAVAAEEGLLLGISSGANVAAALRLAASEELAGSVVVTVGCSTGERYLSTKLWEDLG